MTKIQQKEDSAISRVRKARHEVSAEHEHDPKRVVAYYMKRQQDRKRMATDPRPEKEE
jgi:hypothetical protein